jgi:hypothetical protein
LFNLITESDGVMHVLAWPGSDISGVNSSPPLVDLGQHPQLGGRVYLSKLHVIEALHTIAPVLGDKERELVAQNLGVCTPAEHEELLAKNVELAGEVEKLRGVIDQPWAEVYDFAKEKARIELERVQPAKQPVA